MTYQLFPRLSTARASELRTQIIVADSPPVFEPALLESLIRSTDAFPSTGGARINIDALLAFREECLSSVLDPSDGAGADLALGKKLYELSHDSSGEFGNGAVWDFLTLALLPDVATQRFNLTSKDVASRLTGGNRRHVFQRLWRRWNVLGPEAVESRFFTEDEYQAVLERRITSEMPRLARGVFNEVRKSVGDGRFARREYTRLFMKQLLQTTGLVDISEDDEVHLSELMGYVSRKTTGVLSKS